MLAATPAATDKDSLRGSFFFPRKFHCSEWSVFITCLCQGWVISLPLIRRSRRPMCTLRVRDLSCFLKWTPLLLYDLLWVMGEWGRYEEEENSYGNCSIENLHLAALRIYTLTIVCSRVKEEVLCGSDPTHPAPASSIDRPQSSAKEMITLSLMIH